MKTFRAVLLLLSVVFVGSCATPYQKSGFGGGYSEIKINDSAYYVEFNGNGYATKDRVWYFWMYRCAELTLQSGYDYFTIRTDTPPPAKSSRRDTNILPATYRPGRNNSGHLVKVHGSSAPVYVPTYTTSTVTTWHSKGTVLMFHKPLPNEVLYAYRAQSIIDDLKPYVDSSGSSTPPPRVDLMNKAMVAHVQVDFGGAPGIAIAPSATATAATAGAATGDAPAATGSGSSQPRSADSIVKAVEDHQVVFYQLYQDHVTRTQDRSAGKIVMNFTVTPNGYLTDCKLVSSTFTDKTLNDNALNLFRRGQLAPDNAASTAVSNFTLAFTPRSD